MERIEEAVSVIARDESRSERNLQDFWRRWGLTITPKRLMDTLDEPRKKSRAPCESDRTHNDNTANLSLEVGSNIQHPVSRTLEENDGLRPDIASADEDLTDASEDSTDDETSSTDSLIQAECYGRALLTQHKYTHIVEEAEEALRSTLGRGELPEKFTPGVLVWRFDLYSAEFLDMYVEACENEDDRFEDADYDPPDHGWTAGELMLRNDRGYDPFVEPQMTQCDMTLSVLKGEPGDQYFGFTFPEAPSLDPIEARAWGELPKIKITILAYQFLKIKINSRPFWDGRSGSVILYGVGKDEPKYVGLPAYRWWQSIAPPYRGARRDHPPGVTIQPNTEP
ncbi:hypothetical protein BDV95DRAFT_608416 [Massariosphaeria phaeospora]|uniref:Uncharacterized protein n=1 Tax=Massariosphaeria phaeospora TaxID=100035 RepID=A0A7C8M4T8_9PLEO|nr:hypothetical protein BDV95DRAFT_608416 [Massariosphaeria phaeospora]